MREINRSFPQRLGRGRDVLGLDIQVGSLSSDHKKRGELKG